MSDSEEDLPVTEEDYNSDWDKHTDEVLETHNKVLPEYKYKDYEKYAGRNWHKFYQSNTTHFYKNRYKK